MICVSNENHLNLFNVFDVQIQIDGLVKFRKSRISLKDLVMIK